MSVTTHVTNLTEEHITHHQVVDSDAAGTGKHGMIDRIESLQFTQHIFYR